MKILALDLGDKWTGSALSDQLHIIATPYKTIETTVLNQFLQTIIAQEQVKTIVVGFPLTLQGKHSQQTEKILATLEKFKKQFIQPQWILWDERLTSKQTELLKKSKTKEEKIHAHSRVAAFILQNYLEHLRFTQKNDSAIF